MTRTSRTSVKFWLCKTWKSPKNGSRCQGFKLSTCAAFWVPFQKVRTSHAKYKFSILIKSIDNQILLHGSVQIAKNSKAFAEFLESRCAAHVCLEMSFFENWRPPTHFDDLCQTCSTLPSKSIKNAIVLLSVACHQKFGSEFRQWFRRRFRRYFFGSVFGSDFGSGTDFEKNKI